jgi:hypothetical protein
VKLEVSVNQNRGRNTLFYVILFAAIIILVVYNVQRSPQEALTLSEVAEAVEKEQVSLIVADGDKLRVVYKNKAMAERSSLKESVTSLTDQLP